MPRSTVLVITLGGTIAMASAAPGEGVRPSLGAADLVASIGGLDEDVHVDLLDFLHKPGASLTVDEIASVAEAIVERSAAGTDGFVVVQGTDTLEETAFLLDLLHRGDAPVVVTGAMRNPAQVGADGPANLRAAIQVAAHPGARGLGVTVVFSDEIHAARFVRKTHTTSTGTFRSPTTGPIGHLVEGTPRLLLAPRRNEPPVRLPLQRPARVGLVTLALDDDGGLVEAAADRYDGIVVAAFGVGHVPQGLVPLLEKAAGSKPVVLASRTGAGSTLTGTYGFSGSESDLLSRGLIGAGFLDPYKARLLLTVLLRTGADHAAISRAFAQTTAD